MSLTLPADEPLVATEAESRIAVATQRQLIWWRFRRHKLAVISAVVVIAFYLVAIFADHAGGIAARGIRMPRAATSRRRRSTGSTTGTSIRMSMRLKGKRDLRTFKLSYAPDPSEKRYLALFALGYPYSLFGLIPDRYPPARRRRRHIRRIRCSCLAPISWGGTCSRGWCWRRARR